MHWKKILNSLMELLGVLLMLIRQGRPQEKQEKMQEVIVNVIKEVSLSGKLTPATGKDKTKNELFLVEGDSAGKCETRKKIDVFKQSYL